MGCNTNIFKRTQGKKKIKWEEEEIRYGEPIEIKDHTRICVFRIWVMIRINCADNITPLCNPIQPKVYKQKQYGEELPFLYKEADISTFELFY